MNLLYRIFLHCENGDCIPIITDESIHSIVDRYLDKPLSFVNTGLDDTPSVEYSVVRSIEFLDSVPVHLCGKDFRLVRIYSLKDSYLKKNNLLSKFRVTLEETRHLSVCTMKYKEDAAYIPGMFDPL